jgi:PPM family protein phosphatase
MLKLEAAALTDPGRQRDMNEDRAWSQIYEASEGEAVGLFVLCDGIGGYVGGENASHWAVETVKHELSDLFCPPDPRATVMLPQSELDASLNGSAATHESNMHKLENRVRQAVQKANQVVYEYAKKRPEKGAEAGTTISMGLLAGDRAVVANVGDSRTYLLRDRQLQQITQDHSLVATLVASGQIQPEDIYTHPQRNLIYRSLGHKRDVQVDTFVHTMIPGDHLLFCSDGLWEMVRNAGAIASILQTARTTEEACKQLVAAANASGGDDNIGVIVVRVT